MAVKDKLPGVQAIVPTKFKSPTALALVVAQYVFPLPKPERLASDTKISIVELGLAFPVATPKDPEACALVRVGRKTRRLGPIPPPLMPGVGSLSSSRSIPSRPFLKYGVSAEPISPGVGAYDHNPGFGVKGDDVPLTVSRTADEVVEAAVIKDYSLDVGEGGGPICAGANAISLDDVVGDADAGPVNIDTLNGISGDQVPGNGIIMGAGK